MPEFDADELKLLAAFYRETKGTPGEGVSMWEIGQSLGFDRDRVQDLAMDLNAEGLLEIRSLSGKVALTEAGLEQARTLETGPAPADARDELLEFADNLEASLNSLGLAGEALKDLNTDLDTLRLQAARSKRLAPVLKSILQAIKDSLSQASTPPDQSLLETLDKLITIMS